MAKKQAKKTTKKLKDNTQDALALLLKNAESDPEAYALLQALQLKRSDAQQEPEPEVRKTVTKKQTRPQARKQPKEDVVLNENIQKSKSQCRNRGIRIGKNQFNPKGFQNVGNDPADKIIKQQNVIIEKTRPDAQLITVRCSACGRQEKVSPGYKTGDYYRCISCSRV